ncbi:hypothetical protein FRC06_001576 [Ceratobasidium sp. 370]|nr:hypothetical protein FRC06_001576 [Ceratobasidium sp. 370]
MRTVDTKSRLQDSCRDICERHVDFQNQLRFVKDHQPYGPKEHEFCEEGEAMELRTIRELFHILARTAQLSKIRAFYDRDKISRSLHTLNETYNLGVAHIHTFLPENHAVFRSPRILSSPNAATTPRTQASGRMHPESVLSHSKDYKSDLLRTGSTLSLGPPIPDDASISSLEDQGRFGKLAKLLSVPKSKGKNDESRQTPTIQDPPIAPPTHDTSLGPPLIEPAPHLLDQFPEPAIYTLHPSASLDSLPDQISPAPSPSIIPPNEFEEKASHVPPETNPQQIPGDGLSANPFPSTPQNPVLISRVMPTSEVVAHLGNHGCKDITDQLDLASSSDFPVSNGGFGDVYKVKLRNGTQVAVKTMRAQVDSTDEGAKHLKLNVLVSNDGTPMLTDFGNAVLRDRTLLFTATTMKTSLSPRWAAPEILEGSSLYSTEADVYALGMVRKCYYWA